MHCDYCSMLPKETQRWITAVPNVAPVAWSYDYYHVLFDWEKEDHALIRLLFCWGLSWLLVLYWFVAFFQAFLLSMKCIGYNGESLMDTFVWWHKNFHMCCTYSVSASYKALIKFMFEGLLGKVITQSMSWPVNWHFQLFRTEDYVEDRRTAEEQQVSHFVHWGCWLVWPC